MTKIKALEIVKSGEFRGCLLYDLELIIKLTGSKLAIKERLKKIEAMGSFVKDKHGILIK